MNVENWKKWIKALRSGEYQQTRGVLEEQGRFCCLGVACRVAIKDGLDLRVKTSDKGEVQYGANGHTGSLPIEVRDWLGMRYIDTVMVGDDGGMISVIYLNDTRRWNFNRIADALERKLDAYVAQQSGKEQA